MPASGCLSLWASWCVPVSKSAQCEGWGEEVAELTMVTHLVTAAMDSTVAKKYPRDAKTWHALGKQV